MIPRLRGFVGSEHVLCLQFGVVLHNEVAALVFVRSVKLDDERAAGDIALESDVALVGRGEVSVDEVHIVAVIGPALEVCLRCRSERHCGRGRCGRHRCRCVVDKLHARELDVLQLHFLLQIDDLDLGERHGEVEWE